ncbi:MAG: metallophosphoesterase [Azoarcus sp.]|nr:metallophosphoesterase [Azoarcus sp.]
MSAVVLHLSDIHIKTAKDPILQRGNSIAAATFAVLPEASHVFIVCSGDVAYSGTSEEYDAATGLFADIEAAIRKETNCPINFVFVPGNHDCDFEKNSGARGMLIENMENSNNNLEVDESIVDTCTSVQADFFSFRDCIENNPSVTDDKLWRTSVFQVEDKTIAFDCLNISWASDIRENTGRLFFPIERYTNRIFSQADVRLVVLHHPLNWFSQSIYRPFRTFVRTHANIILTGHEHQGTVGLIDDAESGASIYIEGCVLQGDSKNLADSSFNLAVVDLGPGRFLSTRYEWDGTRYVKIDDGSWHDYHDLPTKRINSFAITQEFQGILEDPGAFFRHPSGTNVALSDIYVYPDLRKVGNEEGRRRVYESSSRLLAPEVTVDGILIKGEEKAGCTSLLYQLYRKYHERRFVPLYINGKDIKKTTNTDIDKIIKRAVEHQYGNAQVEAFMQHTRTQKLLLLDDFDGSPICAGNVRAELLCMLRKRFGHLVVTVGDMFEMHEMLECNASRALFDMAHYEIRPFGHVLRGKLISRWLSFGMRGTVDEANAIAKLDQAEKLITAVMQRGIIPSIPLYLLMLLQSMDASQSGDFRASALGDYYRYLLTETFQNSGVKPDKLTELFQYSAYLAWEFHRKDKSELSEFDLRTFNDCFTKDWHTVDFKPRLDLLLNARVLCKAGEDYAFRYPYIYYYLKGQFLKENLSNQPVQAYIKHCCQHLYVRDYANTVLFLAHHSNDDFVLESIADALHNLFCGRNPVAFNGDTAAINKLIGNAPKLTYSGGKPVENRARRNKLQDELDNDQDGLLENEDDSEEHSLFIQITTLFKTTEILGQVLKNQYSKILRTRKQTLLEDLFNGPLRAIRDFYEFLEQNPDTLIDEIETALQRKGNIVNAEERKSLARKVVASLIQVLSFDFLMRASQSANSESLLEDVKNIVRKTNTPAFRLIELGIILDSPKAIPRGILKQLFEEVKNDLVASRVIQIMVLHRLYMFKTSEQDMQWLDQELEIDLKTQHVITYQENKRRLLN